MDGKKARLKSRDVAAAILMELARHEEGGNRFCCSFFYDYDSDFLSRVAERLGVLKMGCTPFLRRVSRVARELEQCGILSGYLCSCHAEYIGEPRVLKRYEFANHSHECRLAPDLNKHYKSDVTPEWELDYLLDRVYPKKVKD